jgi:hypothetical protein
VHLADAFKPQTETQDPGIIREFDIATQRGLVPPGTTYQQYVTMRNPGMNSPVTIPYGSTVTPGGRRRKHKSRAWRRRDDAMKLPPGSQFRLPEGGSARFREALAATPAAAFHNNPGALRVPGSMQFQRFASPQEGVQAQEALLGRYMDRGPEQRVEHR